MESLTKELERLINERAEELVLEENTHKDKYEYLKYTLLDMVQDAKDLKEDMDKHELKVSSIEAEGFLRFTLNVESLLVEDGSSS